MREPFFVFGAERAGVSLLEVALESHPDVDWGGEFDFALDWPECHEPADWPPLVPYWQHLQLSAQLRGRRLELDTSLRFPDLVRSLLAQQARAGARPLGAAVHVHFDRVVRLWPEARFVHVVRSLGAASEGRSPREAALQREARFAWRSLAARIPSDRRIELRYEELVASPATELARLFGFLALPFDRGRLSEPIATRGARPRIAAKGRTPAPSPALRGLERWLSALLGPRGASGA